MCMCVRVCTHSHENVCTGGSASPCEFLDCFHLESNLESNLTSPSPRLALDDADCPLSGPGQDVSVPAAFCLAHFISDYAMVCVQLNESHYCKDLEHNSHQDLAFKTKDVIDHACFASLA